MKRNWISFTSALFVFQACYGTPHDFGLDFYIEGQVKSISSGLPIKGIKVSVAHNMQYEYTNDEGRFSFHTEIMDTIQVLFEDIDATQNGTYVNKDTLLTHNNIENLFLDIKLEEK
jgi:putative lipoprotein (rSAM/lipoprotein system)